MNRTATFWPILPPLLVVLGMSCLAGSDVHAQPPAVPAKKAAKADEVADPFPNRKAKAPPLEGGLGWLNTAGPIELSKLKGKIVILDFWTFCCINCIHVLPDLAKLEEEFANELVVIGVHSAKFEGEKDTANIRDAILRYDIRHPVVNDGAMEIWRSYGVRSWPTLAVVDPEGHFVGFASGEGNLELLREVLQRLIAYHKAKGTLDSKPISFQLETLGTTNTTLRFPGKAVPDPSTGRLYIADSSHHRVVVADLTSGAVKMVIGDGVPELKDGTLATARFNDPQGMAPAGDVVYVADRKNHALRKIDLRAGTVTTLSGNGNRGFDRKLAGSARSFELASPWDLLLIGDSLHIAMAGTHQLHVYEPKTGEITVFAGSGREDIIDGTRSAAAFAQPSGLATDGKSLFVADSEVSGIRAVSLNNDRVGSLIGKGLFEFGDIDGDRDTARLQHALGVAYHDGVVYVADTYNNKIKAIDLKTGKLSTFLGDGKPGKTDNPPRFDEPGGLAYSDGKLYVADTNNHMIRVIDVASKRVTTLPLTGLTPPAPLTRATPDANPSAVLASPALTLPAKGGLTIEGAVTVPANHKLNPDAPMAWRLERVTATGASVVGKGRITPPAASFRVAIEEFDAADGAKIRFVVNYYPCEDKPDGVCHILTQTWEAPLTVGVVKGAARWALPKPPEPKLPPAESVKAVK